MKTFLLVLLLCSQINDNYIESASRLLGLGDVEELTSEQLERIEDLHEHPLQINFADRSDLLGTGFLSQFQVASILDYIERNGQILSQAELASVPGIGPSRAADLSQFINFSYTSISENAKRKPSALPAAEISMYNSVKYNDTRCLDNARQRHSRLSKAKDMTNNGESATTEASAGTGVKARLSYGNLKYGKEVSVGLGAKEDIKSWYVNYKGKRWIDNLIIGSYNARWGQGLTVWNGFGMNGLSSVAGFTRNASGVGASSTLSGSSALQGAAVATSCRRTAVQALWAAGRAVALHADHYSSHSTIGLTGMLTWEKEKKTQLTSYRGTIAVDGKATMGVFTLFVETALQIVPRDKAEYGAIGGVNWNIGYKKKASLQIRTYSPQYKSLGEGAAKLSTKCSDETAAAIGFEWNDFNWIVEGANKATAQKQILRSTINYSLSIKSLEIRFRHKLKWNSEDKGAKNELSIELRNTQTLKKSELYSSLKAQAGFGPEKDMGILCYADAGIKSTSNSLYIRALYFNTTSWDSRLYAYGRDIPGSFSVPAYYGKGIELSLNAKCKYIAAKLCYTHNVVPPTKSHPLPELRNKIEAKLYLRL